MKKPSVNNFCYIAEQTSFSDDYPNGQFGYKLFDKGNRMYVVFEGILQSFGVLNRNGRYYQADNVMNCIKTDPYITSMLAQNSWMGELEHPSATYSNQELKTERLLQVLPNNTSHFIRRPRLNGNLLEATIQTDSGTEAGRNMAIKIVDGKVIPGFSARLLGDLRQVNGRPTVFIKKLITYDYVLFPSHKEALGKVNSPYAESVKVTESAINGKIIFFEELAKNLMHKSEGAQVLYESFGLNEDDVVGVTETGNSVVLKEKKNIYVCPVSDKTVQTKTRSAISDWLNS